MKNPLAVVANRWQKKEMPSENNFSDGISYCLFQDKGLDSIKPPISLKSHLFDKSNRISNE